MTIRELQSACLHALEAGCEAVTLSSEGRPYPLGYGLPRPELLSENADGISNWRVPAVKLLHGLNKFSPVQVHVSGVVRKRGAK
jgi:hypothetical protein